MHSDLEYLTIKYHCISVDWQRPGREEADEMNVKAM